VLAAIDAGADRFDASLGGLGGCPYAPGATGNVCSEEIVHALQWMGYDTGVDLVRLIDAAKRLPALVGHDIPSQIVSAGRRLDLLCGRPGHALTEHQPGGCLHDAIAGGLTFAGQPLQPRRLRM